jgi:phosphoribosyl-ATP pyrophosphohydrolase
MSEILQRLEAAIVARRGASPDSSYVASLFAKGRGQIAQKVGEEATETVIAALSGNPADLAAEAADLLFHLMILLTEGGLSIDDVLDELHRREGVSGHAEKAARKE